jgi:hypothetical protein
MPIEVVMRESEDDFEVFSAGGNLVPGGSGDLMRDLDALLDDGGSNQQILLGLAGHLLYNYPGSHWSIKVERWDGYVYWLRYDAPELVEGETSRPASPEPEPQRVSRYQREPVI